ncbi:sigma-70 family RNA polymerase sigma factor [Sphingorhabdus soli]|uniref:RNA polymerase sigma factor n=1 Tax=Flavisphingopyxis soli TaxID=2601267 RepID=A0A5C6U936_9SPHN|nr:sigma-70 family RNA polymerase sigma factor [Sphingorhabdus soli]TXC68115.1 sigma-70 family RNA polymerase sigma factor [Sphingorhabdus soli]
MSSFASSTGDSDRQRLVEALEQVARGDRAALRSVYDATSAKLFGICLRISRDRELAEDVLQDVYVKVWRRAGRFDPAKASPITWLAAIARNTAIDAIRKRGRRDEVSDDVLADFEDSAPRADALVEQGQDSARVVDCLDTLEGEQKRSIREAFFGGFTYSELADRRGVPLGTMKSWIRRGLARMKECLGDDRP